MENNNGKNDEKFRILSLDGGGIRGLITALILQEVEKQIQEVEGKEQSLLTYFDMIAGTSTGSVLAAGIATGQPIKKLINMYEKRGKEIFPSHGNWSLSNLVERAKLIGKYGLFAPKYDNTGLCNVLKDFFTENGKEIILENVGRKPVDRKPVDRKKRGQEKPSPILLILAYDTLYRNTTFFTNYYSIEEYPNNTPWYSNKPLWKICASSASAPTFFPGFELSNWETSNITCTENQKLQARWSYPHVDGGVTVNNPSLCAIARALDWGYRTHLTSCEVLN
ncbi:patatin-like phospholipase family protein [Desmonostoc muscorum LEGE 12446]|uniref:Patatin-like phospholipase family protein n=1 Tax=Desmonostoc muscorum LEGE 12446 TaxID=1828758 RepID=A0A8J7A972_DESMC|nr:patatin-like phospholipase family protein [Desmonostoc muscorum]MCF2151174.1 patatin-like phospholipase family protein [Desmonostoc muscorum LEGE 12446]